MSQKRKLLKRAVQVKGQVSEPIVRRPQIRCSVKFCKFHRKASMFLPLFNKAASLKVCNSIKKRLQHSCFPVKLSKFLRMSFLRKSFSGSLWVLTHVFKEVRIKSWCNSQQQIPDSAEKKYLVPRKPRSSRYRCSVKEGLQGPALMFSCECCAIFRSTYFEKHQWKAASENQHLSDKFTIRR